LVNHRQQPTAFETDTGRSASAAGTALPAAIPDLRRWIERTGKALTHVGATTVPTTTIQDDRAAISELPLAEAFR